jgi:acid phosphatase
MKLHSKALPMAALVASALGAWGLTACGGGGSHSTASTSGIVQGSLYEGAKVCIADNSGNATSTCTTSAADGTFTLPGGGPFVADLSGSKEHVVSGDAGTAAPTGLRFHAPAGTTNLSLQSELVWQLMQAGASETDAWTSVGKQFNGLTENQLKGKFSALDSSVQSSLHNSTTSYVKDIAPSTQDLSKIQNVIFIYAENHSFDNLYGNFPGANGIPSTTAPQIDRDGSTLAMLPPIWGGLSSGATVDTAGGAVKSNITEAQTVGMANKPFQIDTDNFNNSGIAVDQTVVTADMYHRFYNEQMQIGADGKRGSTVAWADSGGAPMGYYDGSKMALWQLAKQYTLADNFYQAAFGGSFLNHQYLVCACAPEYPNAATDPATPAIAQVDAGDGKGRTGIQGVALTLNSSNPASAISGKPTFASDQYVTPQVSIDTSTGKATYGNSGTWYGVNTMQPPYQPSSNPPPSGDSTFLTADRSTAAKNTLPAQSKTTIADALDAKSVSWAWYSGAWNTATTAGTTSGHNMSSATAAGVNFQFHHQPFNYYAKFDPTNGTSASYRSAHLKDETDLTAAISGGTLPQVSFYKPNGPYNQHPGYASVKEGDDKIASLVNTIMNSSYKDKVLIVITYDEFGGQWDHARVPKGDWAGPGSRIPALIISPFAKKGFVDHTQYDTASILRFLVKWKELDASTYLPGLAMRDNALVANGGKAMGDLTNALITN